MYPPTKIQIESHLNPPQSIFTTEYTEGTEKKI